MGTHPIFESDFDCLTDNMPRSFSQSRSRSRSRTRSRSRSPTCPRDVDPKNWRSLFIGYLPNHATMDDVESFFKGYGDIESISLKPGYGFITMSHRRDAERIVKNLDGEKMAGEKVDIQHAEGGQSGSSKANNYRRRSRSRSRSISPLRRTNSQPKFCILIQNLTTRCSWQDLKDFVRKETKVETAFCQAHRDKVGEGLVAFNRIQDRDDVLRECDGLEINGKKIKMFAAKKKPVSRGRSFSRSYSRSRSRSRSPPRRRGRYSRSRSRS